nr:hypothetical protein L203_05301 [Cryptococcus depauperatus CBS 7841]
MRDESLVNHGKLDTLSERSNEVNIGSDISVVVFETRECTSGTLERKVEHSRPGTFRGFDTFAIIHGKEEGVKISESEITILRE